MPHVNCGYSAASLTTARPSTSEIRCDDARRARQAMNSPTIPRRKLKTQAMNTRPMIIVTFEPTLSASSLCSITTSVDPTMGPRIVPMPPSSVIRTTSPEVCQCTSLSVANPNTIVFAAPANPEIILSAYYNRDETGGNYGVNALPFLSIVQGALNIDSIPYCVSSGNGQGAYQISPLSKSLFDANPNDKRIPYTWVTERQPSGPKISWITKYPGTKYSDDRVSDNDIIIYRLADIYLLKAEAYAALEDPADAIDYLNKVRERAGNGDYTGPTDKLTLEREILDERGRELYFENKRWYDLLRFYKGGTLDIYNYIPNLIGKTTPLFWPLNTTVLGNNDLLEQTAGY